METHLPYSETFAPEAAELMRRAGKPLDQWQYDGLAHMMALRDDGRWRHFEYCELVPRQNGKGVSLEARVLAGLLLLDEKLILWSAHEYKTAMEAFRRIHDLLKALGRRVNPKIIEVDGIPIKVNGTNGEEGFERLDTGSRVRFIARSKSSGRGFTGVLNIIDEAFAYTFEQHEALLPAMSAVDNPQIVYTSSPPLDGLSGEVLYDLRDRGDPDVPEDERAKPWEPPSELCYRDWGLAGNLDELDGLDLGDRRLWARTNPGRVTWAAMQREYESLGRRGFARERLGIWPKRVLRVTGGGVISEAQWAELADRDYVEQRGRPPQVAFAIHTNLARTYTAIMYAGVRDDGRWQVGVVDWRPGTAWVVERTLMLKDRWDPIGIGLDTKSDALLLEFERAGLTVSRDPEFPERGDLVVPTAAQVAQAYALFLDAVRRGDLRHSDEAPLSIAVIESGTRKVAGGATWDGKGTIEVGPAVAASLALWVASTRIDKIGERYDTIGDVW